MTATDRSTSMTIANMPSDGKYVIASFAGLRQDATA
jgi:hypothetical protein